MIMSPKPVFAGKDIVSVRDLSREGIDHILDVAETMEPLAKSGSDMLRGKIMATLCFEASTRARLRFESAMSRLGGTSLGCTEAKGSSVEKGENLADTVPVFQNYTEVLLTRQALQDPA